jgi:circadian clock protein KaiB
MGPKKPKDSTKAFEEALSRQEDPKYLLRLYVTGTTFNSIKALKNIRKICDSNLKGRCDLEVIDIYQQPVLAEGDQIVAVPTLIKKLPLPLRKFIGDLSDAEKILLGLDLKLKRT